MAKVVKDKDGNLFMSGSIGNSITFLRWKGIQVFKQKHQKRKSHPWDKIFVNTWTKKIQILSKIWAILPLEEKKKYKKRAKKLNITEYHLFIKLFIRRLKDGYMRETTICDSTGDDERLEESQTRALWRLYLSLQENGNSCSKTMDSSH